MDSLWIVVIWFVNFGISWWNARAVGLVWAETKMMGGVTRFMVWMGAIMSACGFSWCFLIFLAIGANYFYPIYFGPKALRATFSLGYLIIIPFIIFSGMMIWIQSLVIAWRRRDLPSMGVAAWNTFAQIHNTYSAIEGMPAAFKEVGNFFSDVFSGDSDDAKGKLAIMVIAIVLLSLIAGIILTAALIKKYAASVPLPERSTRYRDIAHAH